MGRLTKRLGDQVILKELGTTDCGKICDRRKDFDNPCDECPIDDAFCKLAHYEDLEEQLMESAEIDIDSMVGEFMHYYNLQKENRLIELPCAVGDTVYVIGGVRWVGYDWKWKVYDKAYVQEIKFNLDMLGDNIFLTKEEAEAKLKELEGVNE